MIRPLPDECPSPESGLPPGSDEDKCFLAGVKGRRAGEGRPAIAGLGDRFRPMFELQNGWTKQDELACAEGFA